MEANIFTLELLGLWIDIWYKYRKDQSIVLFLQEKVNERKLSQ
jgi:hypothetical protein